MNYINYPITISANNYCFVTWKKKFGNKNISIKNIYLSSSWDNFIKDDLIQQYIKNIELKLSNLLKNNKIMFPCPDLLFYAMNVTSLDDIKVVILGQDPYPSFEKINSKIIPQAMGLSFSVPNELKIPSSLMNIYRNLQKYGHLINIPDNGNLLFWAYQGCLLLNASLTVSYGDKNSHATIWKEFSDKLIHYISSHCEHLVFLLWGSFALTKYDDGLINEYFHKVIISSHPSGLSCNKSLRSKKTNKLYKSFMEVDHFGETNKYLIENNKKHIIWQL